MRYSLGWKVSTIAGSFVRIHYLRLALKENVDGARPAALVGSGVRSENSADRNVGCTGDRHGVNLINFILLFRPHKSGLRPDP